MATLQYPADLKYTKSDEWLRIEGDTATLGISDYAQDALNDLTYVEFQVDAGDTISAGDAVAEVESVKASSEIYAPVGGAILAVNNDLKGAEDTINADPYGKGWLVKIKITESAGLADLMDAAAYQAYCESR